MTEIKKAEEEEVYYRLKYGSPAFVCKCGSKEFHLCTVVRDLLEFRNGRAYIYYSDLSELSVTDFDYARCAKCGSQVDHKKLIEVLRKNKIESIAK